MHALGNSQPGIALKCSYANVNSISYFLLYGFH